MIKIVGKTAIISKDVTELNGNLVSEISAMGATNIEFEVGSELDNVHSNAFNGNLKIEKVDFSNCSELSYIGFYAFVCSKIREVDFSGCTKLKMVDVSAFESCKFLKKVSFENCKNLNQLGNYAFHLCKSLKEINFKGCVNLVGIPMCCFEECNLLDTIDLSDLRSLEIVETSAFNFCISLKEIKFPQKAKKFEKIEKYAFNNCENLKKLDLSHCSIKTLESEFVCGGMLEDLDLSNCNNLKECNEITVLNTIDLRGCENLNNFNELNAKEFKFSFLPVFKDGLCVPFSLIFNSNAVLKFYDKNDNLGLAFNNK